MVTTSQHRKNKMKSENASSESTPLYALLKYGLDGGSEDFKSAVNAYVAAGDAVKSVVKTHTQVNHWPRKLV